jgi:protein phosphatase
MQPLAPSGEPPVFVVGIGHDVGRVRTANEDSLIAITGLQQADSTLPYFGLFIIADGMGGHELGERASRLAAQTFARHVLTHFTTVWLGGAGSEEQLSIQEILEGAMIAANQGVLRHFPGSGTTLTAALVFSNQLFLAHVGDSRAYLVGQQIKQVTRDHSLVQRLIDIGQITPDEASRFAQRNVLLRAIGQTDELEPEFLTLPWETGARLILCSDGLWGPVEDARLLEIVAQAATPQAACEALVQLANAAGGPDNISVICVELAGQQ